MVSNVGEFIKQKRLSKKKTQKDIAQVLGVSESTYCRLEQNKISITAEKALKLAQFFSFKVDEIYNINFYSSNDNSLVDSVITFLLSNLTVDGEKASQEIESLLSFYINEHINKDKSNLEIYQYVSENSDDRNFSWLLEEDDSLDDFMLKIANFMTYDEMVSEIIEKAHELGNTEISDIKQVAETIYTCYECNERFFGCLDGYNDVDDKCFCNECYESLPECKSCGSVYYEYNKEGYCLECASCE